MSGWLSRNVVTYVVNVVNVFECLFSSPAFINELKLLSDQKNNIYQTMKHKVRTPSAFSIHRQGAWHVSKVGLPYRLSYYQNQSYFHMRFPIAHNQTNISLSFTAGPSHPQGSGFLILEVHSDLEAPLSTPAGKHSLLPPAVFKSRWIIVAPKWLHDNDDDDDNSTVPPGGLSALFVLSHWIPSSSLPVGRVMKGRRGLWFWTPSAASWLIGGSGWIASNLSSSLPPEIATLPLR